MLSSGTLHSVGYIFPFLPYFVVLFFPQLIVKPPLTYSAFKRLPSDPPPSVFLLGTLINKSQKDSGVLKGKVHQVVLDLLNSC